MRKTFDVVRCWHTIKQGECRIPCIRDNPVRAFLGRQVMGIGDQRIGAVGAVGGIDRVAFASVVYVEGGFLEPPAFTGQTTSQHTHERQA